MQAHAFRRLALAAAVLVPVQATAQDRPDDPAAAPAATLSTLHGTLQLSIREAIEMGLKNNLDVEVARHDPVIAWQDFRAAWGAYDPVYFSELTYAVRSTPIASALQATSTIDERQFGGQTGFRGKLPWVNATYRLGYAGDRTTTTSSIDVLSPEYTTGLTAELTIPLMRNLIWDQDWTRVKQSRVLFRQSSEDFRRQVMDTVAAIESAYWDLVADDEQLRVARKSVETARALLDQVRTEYEVGVKSRVDVTEAEAGLAQRDFDLIRAENLYRTSMDRLMNEVLGRGLRPGSRLEIVPTDRPQDYILFDIDVEEASRKAFENRPELAVQQEDIARREIELKFRKNQILPQLDFVGTYGVAGLAGDENPNRINFGGPSAETLATNEAINAIAAASPVPVAGFEPLPTEPEPTPPIPVDDGFFNADDDLGADSFSFGGVLSIPLGNGTARRQKTRAEIELRRSRTQLARLRQSIILEVRQAARDLESAQQGIEAAERARVAAEEQLRAEQVRLEQGESTPFDVLQREEALVTAESEKINAIRVYRNSIVGLDRSQGTILKTRNVMLDSDLTTLPGMR